MQEYDNISTPSHISLKLKSNILIDSCVTTLQTLDIQKEGFCVLSNVFSVATKEIWLWFVLAVYCTPSIG